MRKDRVVIMLIAIVIILTLYNKMQKDIKTSDVSRLDTDTVCIKPEVEKEWQIASIYAITVFDKLEGYDFDYILKDNCDNYSNVIQNEELPDFILGRHTVKGIYNTIVYSGRDDISFNHKVHIALHEFGHLVGLPDIYDIEYEGKTIMFYRTDLKNDKTLINLTELDLCMVENGGNFNECE